MTEKEKSILLKTVDIWNEYLELPVQHPNERAELQKAIHDIQGLIACRIARRVEPDFFVTHSGID
jgi:hypothetical protein